MATAVGQRFVRRHNAARTSTANTTAADITYDTAVLSEGGYTWASPEVTVDETGIYFAAWDLGLIEALSTRAVGTLVPSINTTDQIRFRATHRYLRNAGGAQHGASIGMGLFNLTANDDFKIRNPGALTPTDAVGNYATLSGASGGIQLVRMPDGNFTHLERTVDATEVGTSNINATRPWLDSSGTWTTVTYNSEVQDDAALYPGTGGDVTLAANTKYLIVWGTTSWSTDASRHTYVTRLQINSVNVQTGSGYQRNASSQGPPIVGAYLHETGGSTETLRLQATHETEGGDAGTPNVSDAYLQILELPSTAEWIHVDNGTTDSLTTALAAENTWYTTPLSSTFRADGGSNLSLDAANDQVDNDSGADLGVLAFGWARWDRDAGASGGRKNPWGRFNNGTGQGYGISGAYSRGAQSNDDTWQAHYCSAWLGDIPSAGSLTFEHRDDAGGAGAANNDMGIYASTSRYFLGVQVLDLGSLEDAGGTPGTVTPATIAATATVPQPALQTGAAHTAIPAVVAATATAPTPTLIGGAVITPTVIAATATVPNPTAFEPVVVPDPGELLRADMYTVLEPSTTGVSDGTDISTWNDDSNEALSFTSQSGNDPTYVEDYFNGHGAIEARQDAHMSALAGANIATGSIAFLYVGRWLANVGIRHVIASQAVGGSINDKHALGTDSAPPTGGGAFHVVMSGDGSSGAHGNPESHPGADGGDFETAIADEEHVVLHITWDGTSGPAADRVDLYYYTYAGGWKHLIQHNSSGNNAYRGMSLFRREDGNSLTAADFANGGMRVFDANEYTLAEMQAAGEEMAQWRGIKPSLKVVEIDGHTAEFEIWYKDPDAFNSTGTGAITSNVKLNVSGGTVAATLVGPSATWKNDVQYGNGTHDLGSLPVDITGWEDFERITVRAV
ncbi:MAG: hypothetical protein DWQ40_00455 [Actinobacteria bacterium]|nr:MAG: hypothetical protein DWQ40_00455 [Actinomycetota bacterium]REK34104.1 MAG: hypothetical protein DWQ20_07035 [Actinomycetota bacterium]